MKRIANILLLLLSACLMGCGGGSEKIPDPLYLRIDKASFSADYSGTSTTVKISSNVTWSASVTVPWVEINSKSGTGDGSVTITVKPNPDADSRSTTVTFSGGGQSASLSISQSAAPVSLKVAPETLKYTADGGTLNTEITSNGSWTVQSSETWCKPNITSGKGNSTLTITVEANSTSAARSANVFVKCSNVEKRILVNQDAGVIIPSEDDNGTPKTPAPKLIRILN